MEAIRQLAAGVAHELNNLLLSISTVTDLMRERLASGSDVGSQLERLATAVARGAELGRNLVAVAGRQALHPRAVELNETILDAEDRLRRLLGEDIELHIKPNPEPCSAFVDPRQLWRLLDQLVVAARSAMPDGGQLTLAIGASAPGPANSVSVAVRLSSFELDASLGERIFEPYASASGSRGAGLALAVAKGIADQSGGRIEFSSDASGGAVFTLRLPSA
jgi:signal transduction histidine kinase